MLVKRIQIKPMTHEEWVRRAEDASLIKSPNEPDCYFVPGDVNHHQVKSLPERYASGGHLAEVRPQGTTLIDRVAVRLLQSSGTVAVIDRVKKAFADPPETTQTEVPKMEAYRYVYTQGGEERDFYATSIPACKLVPNDEGTNFTIDQLAPDNPDGYQRAPAEKRFKGFAEYVLGYSNESKFLGNIISQPIVLNAREPMEIQLVEGCEHFAHITLPETAWIVDGQHRRGGIVRAVRDMHEDDDLRNLMVPLIIINGMRREEEAVLFYIINQTMVKVAVDVAQRIAYQWTSMEGIDPAKVLRSWMPKAIELVDGLNGHEKSAWYKKVKTPGSSVRGGVSQGAFIRSLDMLLKNVRFSGAPVVQLTKLLVSYWDIIKSLLPEAFENPRKHIIQKTTGLTVMNRLLPVISDLLEKQGKPTNLVTLREILTVVLSEGSVFWENKVSPGTTEVRAARFGTNNKGFNQLAEWFQEVKLNPMMKRRSAEFTFDAEDSAPEASSKKASPEAQAPKEQAPDDSAEQDIDTTEEVDGIEPDTTSDPVSEHVEGDGTEFEEDELPPPVLPDSAANS